MSIRTLALALITTTLLGASASFAQQANSTVAGSAEVAVTDFLSVQSLSPAIRVVRYNNPPFNLIVPQTIASLNQIVQELSADQDVKVVIFESDIEGFFFNHYDLEQFPTFLGQVGANAKPLWVELVNGLSNAPFVSIASIRGKTQGGGNELALAFDLRYASAEKAVFLQPEVGIGIFPGGGGTDRLTRLVGKDRALEVFLSADSYDAVTAEKYGWVTRTLPDAELDGFVLTLAQRLATFDKTALITAKQEINAIAGPTEPDLLHSYGEFIKSVSWTGFQPRLPFLGAVIGEFCVAEVENHLGKYLGEANQRYQNSLGQK